MSKIKIIDRIQEAEGEANVVRMRTCNCR